MELLSKTHHEHIIHALLRIKDHGRVESVILEHCDESLDTRFRRQHGIIAPGMQALLFSHMVAGVDHMHALHVAHRDLKMENMLLKVTPVGILKLLLADFGYSREFASGTDLAATMCFPKVYRPPEIVGRLGHSLSVDVWSLGLVLRELLLGRRVYQTRIGCQEPDLSDLIATPSPRVLAEVSDPRSKYHKFLPLVEKRLGKGSWTPYKTEPRGAVPAAAGIDASEQCVQLLPECRISARTLCRHHYVTQAVGAQRTAKKKISSAAAAISTQGSSPSRAIQAICDEGEAGSKREAGHDRPETPTQCTCKYNCGNTKGQHRKRDAPSEEPFWIRFRCQGAATEDSPFCKDCKCSSPTCQRVRLKSLWCHGCRLRRPPDTPTWLALQKFAPSLAQMLPMDLVAFLAHASGRQPGAACVMALLWEPWAIAAFAKSVQNATGPDLHQPTAAQLHAASVAAVIASARMREDNWEEYERGMATLSLAGMQRHLGCASTMLRFGVLEKLKAGSTAQGKVFTLGVSSDKYKVVRAPGKLQQVVTNFHFQVVWQQHLQPKEMIAALEPLHSAYKHLDRSLGLSSGYLMKHSLRKFALLGTQPDFLQGARWSGITIRELSHMMPDETSQQDALPPAWDLGDLHAWLEFKVSPMLTFSWTCLFDMAFKADPSMKAVASQATPEAFEEARLHLHASPSVLEALRAIAGVRRHRPLAQGPAASSGHMIGQG